MRETLDIWCINNGEFGKNLIDSWTGIEVDKNNIATGRVYNITDITKGCSRRFKFICSNNHVFYNEINKITYSKRWCAQCNQLKINKQRDSEKQVYNKIVTQTMPSTLVKNNNNKREKLEGREIGNFKILEYLGDKKYKCECKCENKSVEIVSASSLKNSKYPCCKKCRSKISSESQRKHLEGTIEYNWKYLEYVGNSKYKCMCLLCNKVYDVDSREISRGRTKCCKKCSGNSLKDLTNQIFGSYKAIEYIGNHYWKCICLNCGDTRNVTSQHLTLDGNNKCIKCSNKEQGRRILEETINSLIGKHIHNLKVLDYNYESNKFVCECQCENKTIIEVRSGALKGGSTKSCGCITQELKRKTMIERYGDIASKRIHNPRRLNDIEGLENKEIFMARYNEVKRKINRIPTSLDLAIEFDVNTSIALKYAHMYNVEVDTDTGSYSLCENEILNTLKSINNNINIIQHDRKMINPQELDFYIQDKKVAIEFNGSYWHSTLFLDKRYHQNKTIACAKKGIRLIHIFEHEWKDDTTRIKLENMLHNIVGTYGKKIRASSTSICNISTVEAKEFLDKYHLQNNAKSEIKLGLKYNDELVAVMTFGSPRFESCYEYELIRYSTNCNYRVYGAASKLFNYFVTTYKPNSIVTYCDITKFSGNMYTKLGFKTQAKNITEPNYVWVNPKLQVLTRYQTQKHKLVSLELGDEEQTEDEIMSSLGYFKVYGSGNLKLEWKK